MKKFFFKRHSKSKQYLFSIIITVLVSAICFGLSEFLGYRVVALILLFTVSLLAITFDILPVLLAAALSAFIWNFLFYPSKIYFSCLYYGGYDLTDHVFCYCNDQCGAYI